jgi:shikimate kinase
VIVLVGFMGAGKTTVGRLLARSLRLPFLDSDEVIEERHRRRVRDIFAEDGEPAFRRIERETVLDLLRGDDAVLALGGGAVQDPVTRRAVADAATVVYLDVAVEQVRARVGEDPRRPLLAGGDVDALLERRRPQYEEAATMRVAAGGRRPGEVADEVLARLAGTPDGPFTG